MGGKTVVMKIGIVWAIISFLTGCALFQGRSNPIYTGNLEPHQYWTEIARLEAMVLQNPESSKRWQAHYQLAQLYISYENPRRNFRKSFENLELYLLHHPNSVDDPNRQDWPSVLDEILQQSPIMESQNKEIERLTAELDESVQANLALEEANSKLEEDNAELVSKIDLLKTLDHSVEEKRKNYESE
jgi:hypothetical protein